MDFKTDVEALSKTTWQFEACVEIHRREGEAHFEVEYPSRHEDGLTPVFDSAITKFEASRIISNACRVAVREPDFPVSDEWIDHPEASAKCCLAMTIFWTSDAPS